MNMVIPILMHFCSFLSIGALKAKRTPRKCVVINDVKIFPTVYHRIYSHNFLCYPIRCRVTKIVSEYDQEIPQSQTADKIKCIRLLLIRAGIHKLLVRIAYWEDPDQTASSEAV